VTSPMQMGHSGGFVSRIERSPTSRRSRVSRSLIAVGFLGALRPYIDVLLRLGPVSEAFPLLEPLSDLFEEEGHDPIARSLRILTTPRRGDKPSTDSPEHAQFALSRDYAIGLHPGYHSRSRNWTGPRTTPHAFRGRAGVYAADVPLHSPASQRHDSASPAVIRAGSQVYRLVIEPWHIEKLVRRRGDPRRRLNFADRADQRTYDHADFEAVDPRELPDWAALRFFQVLMNHLWWRSPHGRA
jgi:hypothetical protein